MVIYKESKSDGEPTLELITQIGGFSVVLDVSVFSVEESLIKIAAADLMRSVTLLCFDSEKQTLSTIARELSPRWLSAALIVDNEHVVFADSNFNLGVLQQSINASDEDIIRLTNVGEQYSGNFINRFRIGRLSSLASVDVIIFGCISGAIGLIAPLTNEEYALLLRLQNSMESIVGCVGGFDAKGFRKPNSTTPTRSSEVGLLIDGDLCEMLLGLNDADRQQALSCFESVEVELIMALIHRMSLLK